MNRISQHLDQTNGLDCDMSYQQQQQQLVAPTQSMRFDQEQQQLFHQKHQQQNATAASQNYGQRAVVSVVNQCEPIIYHQQSKHIYEEYPQQVLSRDNSHHNNNLQPLYMQQQPQFVGDTSSMYHAEPNINRHLQQQQQQQGMIAYETQPSFTTQQVQYIPHITQVQMIGPHPQYSYMLNRPAITTRHHQQYEGLVMQRQQQLPPPPPSHPLQQPLLPLPMRPHPPTFSQHQHQQQLHPYPNLQQQQQNQNSFNQHIQLMSDYQQPTITRAQQNGAQLAGEVLDDQIYYQEQMDLHPTIKQQEQQAAASLTQDRTMPITMAAGSDGQQRASSQLITTNIGPYREASICTNQLLPQPQQPVVETEANLLLTQQQQYSYTQQIIAQQPISQQLQQQQQQLVSRSKSDLNSPVSIKDTFNFMPASETHIRSQQHRSRSSTLSYVEQQQLQQPRSLGVQPEQPDQKQQQHQEFVDMRSSGSISQDWLNTICGHLIDHMNRFGICVIDNFLGQTKGDSILNEVKQLYSSGRYTKGKLVNSDKLVSKNLAEDFSTIRNDRVIWIDGCEDGCSEINNLIQTLCSVITNSSRMSLYSNNGLDRVVIKKRTKAHVACYPGNGTRYIKHVDNPNGDGRVITSIYYLNKDWNSKHDGGLLRMFPAGMNEVANIEPLFDRALFFWSDRRNPHEVLPAYKDRFAITVWYIGENRP